MGDITVSRADLLDMGQEPAAVVVRVLGTVVQAQSSVHIIIMAEYIKVLVTFYLQPASGIDRLDILTEHAHILAISRLIYKDPHL